MKGLFPTCFFLILSHPLLAQNHPVIFELFTHPDCFNCTYALEAAEQLDDEFSNNELVILHYPLQSDHSIPSSLSRTISYYGEKRLDQLPFAFFNGTSKIIGANKTIKTSYRTNINALLNADSDWQISSSFQIQESTVVASATFSSQLSQSNKTYELYFALIQKVPDVSSNLVIHFNNVASITTQSATHSLQFTNLSTKGNGSLKGVWFLQEPTSKHIIHSSKSQNLSPILRDLNLDQRFNAQDLLHFSTTWKRFSTENDLNHDGRIDAKDLLLILGPEP